MLVTRFAPTPSGYLHAGNIVNLVLTHWLVRRGQGAPAAADRRLRRGSHPRGLPHRRVPNPRLVGDCRRRRAPRSAGLPGQVVDDPAAGPVRGSPRPADVATATIRCSSGVLAVGAGTRPAVCGGVPGAGPPTGVRALSAADLVHTGELPGTCHCRRGITCSGVVTDSPPTSSGLSWPTNASASPVVRGIDLLESSALQVHLAAPCRPQASGGRPAPPRPRDLLPRAPSSARAPGRRRTPWNTHTGAARSGARARREARALDRDHPTLSRRSAGAVD